MSGTEPVAHRDSRNTRWIQIDPTLADPETWRFFENSHHKMSMHNIINDRKLLSSELLPGNISISFWNSEDQEIIYFA